ncbi:MAG TPA: serine hydrolase domain-containing protein [Beutenbergiaceae bacterium]|nr:serine hydrolase domain-containing protein [Beutenbergiaceae bacterium]
MTHAQDARTIRQLSEYLEQWLSYRASYLRVPGVQAAVRVGSELVLDVALGVANSATGEPLRSDHLFRIASHSKTFTGTAIMQLAERGLLRLDDRLGEHIDELDDAPIGAVTVREALGHQGGVIRDGKMKGFWQRMAPFPDREGLIAMARDEALVYDRNEHFKYSNVAYALLGLVVESASGSSYHRYLQEHVVNRLGLTNTGPEYDPARAADFVHGHTGLLHGTDEREPIEHVDSRAFVAATGFYSTAADMTRYGAAHFLGDDTLLTDDSKRLMQRVESAIQAPGVPAAKYGVGMSLQELGERTLVGHSGGYPGHITRTFIDPVDQIVVSVLTNAIDGPADALASGIFRLIDLALSHRRGPSNASASAATAPDSDSPGSAGADLSRFTGRFAGLWGVSDVVDLGGQLYLLNPALADPSDGYLRLQPQGPDAVRIARTPGFGAVGEQITYERDDDGSILSLLVAGGRAWPVAEFLARRSDLARGPLPAP